LFHELPVVGREQGISLDGGAPVARNTLELGSKGRSSWDAFAGSFDESFNDRLACLIAIASTGDVIRREIFQTQQCRWAFALASFEVGFEVALAGKSSRTDATALFIIENIVARASDNFALALAGNIIEIVAIFAGLSNALINAFLAN
jgi:hypothetical protein